MVWKNPKFAKWSEWTVKVLKQLRKQRGGGWGEGELGRCSDGAVRVDGNGSMHRCLESAK